MRLIDEVALINEAESGGQVTILPEPLTAGGVDVIENIGHIVRNSEEMTKILAHIKNKKEK